MKCLSIRQPWASLIFVERRGWKNIENRSWPTDHRGWFYVHAAKTQASDSEFRSAEAMAKDARLAVSFASLPMRFGGIIGMVKIVGCVRQHRSPWFVGPYGFVLEDPYPLPFEPLQGQRGFWNYGELALPYTHNPVEKKTHNEWTDYENHQKFLAHLEQSQSGTSIVSDWFRSRGFDVAVLPIKKAPNRAAWKAFADQGDLTISKDGKWYRVEVKQLGVDFTSAEDWPFGEKFIVCAQHSFDRASPKPSMYVILSKSGTHAATVNRSSFQKWTVEQKTDSRYEGVSQHFYLCPMSEVSFTSLYENHKKTPQETQSEGHQH